MTIVARIVDTKINIDEVTQCVHDDTHGAIDLFIGKVRNHHNGQMVQGIAYDAQEKLAEKAFYEICREAQNLWSGTRYAVFHYKGELAVGGISIAIAVSSAHRAGSFEACRYVIEEIKKRAPIWKQEHYQAGKSEWLPGHSLNEQTQPNHTQLGKKHNGEIPDLKQIAGIVLAGGKSSRMGQNKALLFYKGKPMAEHMLNILKRTGIEDVFISGSLEGYPCLEDDEIHAGPAAAIRDVLKRKPGYQGYIFVPVDMPLLRPEILKELISQKRGCYFTGWPLPAFLTPPFKLNHEKSVQRLLDANDIRPLNLPQDFEGLMINANTPEEWKKAVGIP
ncbi:MAG: hypothetical protein EYC62_01155 [Alphaproteobacteria bacterium]|nr:MAG: hypothetical protein EYC62_01155 [Alphaproteobacteria bacterium]